MKETEKLIDAVEEFSGFMKKKLLFIHMGIDYEEAQKREFKEWKDLCDRMEPMLMDAVPDTIKVALEVDDILRKNRPESIAQEYIDLANLAMILWFRCYESYKEKQELIRNQWEEPE